MANHALNRCDMITRKRDCQMELSSNPNQFHSKSDGRQPPWSLLALLAQGESRIASTPQPFTEFECFVEINFVYGSTKLHYEHRDQKVITHRKQYCGLLPKAKIQRNVSCSGR